MAPAGDVLRRRSCGCTPCKIVERILKGLMHAVRIVRCQDPLAPGLERCDRRTAALGGDLQRPAEMFAGMAKADAQSVVAANLIIERPDMVELLRQRRRGFDDTGCEAAPDLTGQPRLALRATADHHGVGARHSQRGYGLLERCDVAVDDERDANRIPDSAHRAPIRLALVELTTRTP